MCVCALTKHALCIGYVCACVDAFCASSAGRLSLRVQLCAIVCGELCVLQTPQREGKLAQVSEISL